MSPECAGFAREPAKLEDQVRFLAATLSLDSRRNTGSRKYRFGRLYCRLIQESSGTPPVARFKKPPIVEAWIAFDFEPKADKVAWDMARAQEFTQQQKERFPKVEVMIRQEYKIEESKGSLPRVVSQERIPEVVRMRDEESTRVLQIADDRLAYNVLEGGPAYPGFETLLAETLEYLDRYRNFFEPAGIREATIHYVDIIVIPTAGTIEIDHYFNVVRDLPVDPFGYVAGFTTALVTKCPFDDSLCRSRSR